MSGGGDIKLESNLLQGGFNDRLARLCDRMPEPARMESSVERVGSSWTVKMQHISLHAIFVASGLGSTPGDAFAMLEEELEIQLQGWHEERFSQIGNDRQVKYRHPKVRLNEDFKLIHTNEEIFPEIIEEIGLSGD